MYCEGRHFKLVKSSKKLRYLLLVCIAIFGLVVIIGSGGGDDGGAGGNDDTPAEGDVAINNKADIISGFDFTLSEGDYWEYYWASSSTSGSQDGSGSSSDAGSFQITLDAPITVSNFQAYPLLVSGKMDASGKTLYAPDWTHIALYNNQILGSKDGVEFHIIFDAVSSQWQGGGFFTDFGSETVKRSSSSVSNDFINTTAISVGLKKNQSLCTYYPSVGQTICPNDESYTIKENEYYKAGIGPIAYTYSFRLSNSGGGFTTWRTESREIGLVSTNLSSPDGFQPTFPPWISKTSLSSSITHGYSAAAIDGKIYLTGGRANYTKYHDSLNIYDTLTDSWSTGASIPSELSDHSSVSIAGKIYVTGGYNSTSSETNTIYEYDPSADSWDTFYPSMMSERENHVSVEFDNAILTLGGLGQTSVEFVYPGYSSNGDGEDMPIKMNHMAGASHGTGDDQRVYIMGGVKYNKWKSACNEAEYLSTCYKLNPYTWGWNSCASMPTVRANLSVVELDNKIYAIGGRNCSGATNKVQVYSPISNSWALASPMLYSVANSSAVSVGGKIYVFYANDGKINVEEYDPSRE